MWRKTFLVASRGWPLSPQPQPLHGRKPEKTQATTRSLWQRLAVASSTDAGARSLQDNWRKGNELDVTHKKPTVNPHKSAHVETNRHPWRGSSTSRTRNRMSREPMRGGADLPDLPAFDILMPRFAPRGQRRWQFAGRTESRGTEAAPSEVPQQHPGTRPIIRGDGVLVFAEDASFRTLTMGYWPDVLARRTRSQKSGGSCSRWG